MQLPIPLQGSRLTGSAVIRPPLPVFVQASLALTVIVGGTVVASRAGGSTPLPQPSVIVTSPSPAAPAAPAVAPAQAGGPATARGSGFTPHPQRQVARVPPAPGHAFTMPTLPGHRARDPDTDSDRSRTREPAAALDESRPESHPARRFEPVISRPHHICPHCHRGQSRHRHRDHGVLRDPADSQDRETNAERHSRVAHLRTTAGRTGTESVHPKRHRSAGHRDDPFNRR